MELARRVSAMKPRGIMKCATCGETFGCDGPAIGPQYCSERCDPVSWEEESTEDAAPPEDNECRSIS
jgi:hypothetical protein